MAVYKVPQDIEAEDKLVGPFTLKQFVFGIITIFIGYVGFLFAQMNLLLVIPFIGPFALFAFLAAPISRDQPTDVYLGARLKFLLKPRKRVWDQAGQVELVRITVPKKIAEPERTDGLDQGQVRSRLTMLASTIDTRGWATKNVLLSDSPQNSLSIDSSDRLITPQDMPQTVPDFDITAADDVLDPFNNPTAQRMDQLAQQATSEAKQRAMSAVTSQEPVTKDAINDNEAEKIIQSHHANPYPDQMRQHIVKPLSQKSDNKVTQNQPKTNTLASIVDPAERAKIELSRTNDLSVDTIAREADRVEHTGGDNEEVVIKLH